LVSLNAIFLLNEFLGIREKKLMKDDSSMVTCDGAHLRGGQGCKKL
jgi:hypothetical protein